MTRQTTARLVLAIVFVGLLATPALMRRYGHRAAPRVTEGTDPRAAYGFRLTESAKAAGLEFVHEAPTLDSKLAHIMPQVASMGAAVSVADFDADGHPDLYVTNSREGSANRLYRNRGDGTFEDVAVRLGVADLNRDADSGAQNGGTQTGSTETGVSMGSVWGDYDNDGFEDLLLYRWGRTDLFHNDAGRGFTRVTDTAGLPRWANINTGLWLDFDRDGRLDIFLGGYYPERVNLWKLVDTKMMPESFEYATNGGRKYLYRNLGGGRFEEVSEKVGLTSRRWALAAVAANLRGIDSKSGDSGYSGYPDLFIANDYGVSELFLNEGGRFREAGRETGVGYAPKSGMNASVGDVLNQGQLAIYVSNISEEGILIQGNNLWVPSGTVAGAANAGATNAGATNAGATSAGPTSAGTAAPRYENLATAMGIDLGGWSFGAQFGDLNNDGRLDLYLVNGYVSASRDANYWYDYSKIAGGHEVVISDAKNWPAMGTRSLAGYQQKKVWINDGAGHFVDVAPMVGVTDRHDGRSVALADLSGRGMLDVIVANQRGPLLLYRNDVAPGRDWIAFDVQGSCGASSNGTNGTNGSGGAACTNRSGIGVRVTVQWSDRPQSSASGAQAPSPSSSQAQVQTQEVSGGSGFCAQNQRRLHFGLGAGAQVSKVTVYWPSGKTDTLTGLAVNRVHTLKESA